MGAVDAGETGTRFVENGCAGEPPFDRENGRPAAIEVDPIMSSQGDQPLSGVIEAGTNAVLGLPAIDDDEEQVATVAGNARPGSRVAIVVLLNRAAARRSSPG